MNKEETKHRVEYADIDYIKLLKPEIEKTYIEGVMNYRYRDVYLPVLDRKYIDKFNPKATCISLKGNKDKNVKNEDKFIKQVIRNVERLKHYHLNNTHGISEHIGEYSLFDWLAEDLEGYMLDSYTFEKTDNDDTYYLIAWFKPYENLQSRHLYWYGKKSDCEWY